MKRQKTGEYRLTKVAGETIKAFIPLPLPPIPPLEMDNGLKDLHDSVLHVLGRLDNSLSLLPESHILRAQYIRKEAVESSKIEGIQANLSDLFISDIGEQPAFSDVAEITNYMCALEYGLHRLRCDGFPISSRLLREVHAKLFSSKHDSAKTPGEFRRSQNWIGGTSPSTARFVPPPHTEVEDCITAVERFLHSEGDSISPLIKAGLAHVQFETIHPFLDGNGRTGRLLITFLLCDAGVLSEPLLYLSQYFNRHRPTYYDMLDSIRKTGNWEAWLKFFLLGVIETAENSIDTARKILELFKADEAKIQQQGKTVEPASAVYSVFREQAILSIAEAGRRTRLTLPAVSSVMGLLEQMGIVAEMASKSQNRLYVYHRYISLLDNAA